MYFNRWITRVDVGDVFQFVEENPEKSSVLLMDNGEIMIDFKADQLRSLGTQVDTIILIEFAEQVVQGRIDPNERIHKNELARFYLSEVNDIEHNIWLEEMEAEGHLQNDIVTLLDIANGMFVYDSNANAEYLMMRLGLDHINRRLTDLSLSKHEQIFPYASAFIIPYEIAQMMGLRVSNKNDEEEIVTYIENMSQEDFIEETMKIHQKLVQDEDGDYKRQVDLPAWFSRAYDQVISRRCTRSTAKEYAILMKKINEGVDISPKVLEYLRPMMEWPMDLEYNRKNFKYVGGGKGANRQAVSFAFYGEDKQGNKLQVSAFFDELKDYEAVKLLNNAVNFQTVAFTDDSDVDQEEA